MHWAAKLLPTCVMLTALLNGTATIGAPLVLSDEGSFFVGGEKAHTEYPGRTAAGVQSPPGTRIIRGMYTQYRVPEQRNAVPYPIVLIHGGRHSGATWETTPDGREGWATHFPRIGYSTYVVDAPGMARSGFDGENINKGRATGNTALVSDIGVPTTEERWTTFRFGPAYPKAFDGTQFPLDAIEQYSRQWVPTVDGTLSHEDWAPAFGLLIDRIGPSVLLTHSSSGQSGWDTVILRKEKVRAIVAIEPGHCEVADSDLEKFRQTAVVMIFGDFIAGSRWKNVFDECHAVFTRLKAAGVNATFVSLPGEGIKGNTHMMMMDKNNLVVADMIDRWLKTTLPPSR